MRAFALAGRRMDDRPGIAALVAATGLSRSTLRPSYPKSAEMVERIGRAAAALLTLSPDEMVDHLFGGDQPAIAAAIDHLLATRQCGGCEDWFPVDQIDPVQRRCFFCRLTPAITAWVHQMDDHIEPSSLPQCVKDAWQAQRGQLNPRALMYDAWARAAKLTEDELKIALDKARLPDRPAGRPRTRPRVAIDLLLLAPRPAAHPPSAARSTTPKTSRALSSSEARPC